MDPVPCAAVAADLDSDVDGDGIGVFAVSGRMGDGGSRDGRRGIHDGAEYRTREIDLMAVQAKRMIVAITGASGALYARRILQGMCAAAGGVEVHLVVSTYGRRLLQDELGIEAGGALDVGALIPGAD